MLQSPEPFCSPAATPGVRLPTQAIDVIESPLSMSLTQSRWGVRLLVYANIAMLACNLGSGVMLVRSRPEAADERHSRSYTPPGRVNTPGRQLEADGLSALRSRAAEVVGKKAEARLRDYRGMEDLPPIERMIETEAQKEYAILIERLRIPPEQREGLYQLLAQLNVTRMVQVGLDSEERLLLGLPDRYSTSPEDALDQLRRILGGDGFSTFEKYRETIPARRLFASLEKQGASLAEAQREALVQAFSSIAREPYPAFTASDADKASFFEQRAQQYDALVAANTAGLDQPGRAALEDLLQRKLEADLRRYREDALKRSLSSEERSP